MTEPRGSRVPVRWRIVGWLVLTTLVGLVAVATTVSATLRAEVAEDANADVTQELEEFRDLARDGRDPRTAEPFGSSRALVELFLSRQRPAEGEYLIAQLPDGTVLKNRGPGTVVDGYDLAEDPDAMARTLQGPSGIMETPAGAVRWGKVDLVDGSGQAAGRFVVAIFVDPAEQAADRVVRLLGGVSVVVLVLASLVSWVVAGRILRPLRLMQRDAQRITEDDPGRRLEVHGEDDLADLARTINGLLDRLENAIATEQRFVDGAGFELREPITRSRRELSRVQPRTEEERAAVAAVAHHLEGMEEVLADLRTLARAERPGFLARRTVTSGEIADALRQELPRVADRAWVCTGVDDVSADLDPARLLLAVRQIAENAADHTATGDRVEWSVRRTEQDGTAHLEVALRDVGPGVDLEHAERLFSRFAHDDDDRTRLGLGLAVVRAVADAHGGSAFVADGRPGAVFGIAVPAKEDA